MEYSTCFLRPFARLAVCVLLHPETRFLQVKMLLDAVGHDLVHRDA